MKQRLKPQESVQVLYELIRSQSGRERTAVTNSLAPQLVILRAWQAERLARTHADFLRQPRYQAGCQFILTDLYGPHDFSQRDKDAEELYHFLNRFVPEQLLGVLAEAIEMNQLSQQLDDLLLDKLVNELGMEETITPEMYAAAYRLCDNRADRERQLALVLSVGQEIDRIVGQRFSRTLLGLAKRPSYKLGWREFYDFLDRGLSAFRTMGGADEFLQTVIQREQAILDGLFAGDSRIIG